MLSLKGHHILDQYNTMLKHPCTAELNTADFAPRSLRCLAGLGAEGSNPGSCHRDLLVLLGTPNFPEAHVEAFLFIYCIFVSTTCMFAWFCMCYVFLMWRMCLWKSWSPIQKERQWCSLLTPSTFHTGTLPGSSRRREPCLSNFSSMETKLARHFLFLLCLLCFCFCFVDLMFFICFVSWHVPLWF